MAQAATPITVQGHGANPPDNLTRVRDHSSPTRVPPSLDPNVFSVHDDYANDPLVALARSALGAGKTAGEKALQMSVAVLADESQTLHQRHLTVRDKAYAATKPAMTKLQDTIEKLGDKIAALTDACAGPPAPINAMHMIAVVAARNALAAMDHATRRKAILDGIKANDKVTCMAATRAPGYLLGISPEEMATYSDAWAQQHMPQHMEHRKVLAEVLSHVERGGQLLLNFSNSLASTRIARQSD